MNHPKQIARQTIKRVNDGAMISFAQNYEDVILRKLFGEKQNGFYVDVGAFHPIKNSVTKYFYDMGWTGVNLEPNLDMLTAFEEYRPRDTNLDWALSSSSGRKPFYVSPDQGWSTLNSELADAYSRAGDCLIAGQADTHTLEHLFETVVNQEVDFLKIDVEGHEREVILGGNWQKFRPTVLIAETTAPLLLSESKNDDLIAEWKDLDNIITRNNYTNIYFDGLNTYYLNNDKSGEVSRNITPPNYFDNFVRYNEWLMANAIIAT